MSRDLLDAVLGALNRLHATDAMVKENGTLRIRLASGVYISLTDIFTERDVPGLAQRLCAKSTRLVYGKDALIGVVPMSPGLDLRWSASYHAGAVVNLEIRFLDPARS